jgi:hypothetical protein
MDWLLGRRDPSTEWKADPGRALELDLETSSLCGVAIGESVERFAFLGPPDNPWPSRGGDYGWHGRGFEIQSEDGRWDCLILHWPRDGSPFAGRVFWRGKPLALSTKTRREELTRLIGPPYRADDEDDEPVLYYEHGDVEWQIEFAEDGGLLEWMLVKPGLYADPEWRAKHGITTPYPPPRGQGAPL